MEESKDTKRNARPESELAMMQHLPQKRQRIDDTNLSVIEAGPTAIQFHWIESLFGAL